MKKATLSILASLLCFGLLAVAQEEVSRSSFPIQAEQVGPILYKTNDGVFACEQDPASGLITVKYIWPNPAVVYQADYLQGELFTMFPDRQLGSTYFCLSSRLDLYP